MYDPAFGRFLQTDPIGSKDDLDLYAYTGGDPINNGDSTGEWTFQIGISAKLNIFGIKANVQAGIAFDDKGNVAAYGQRGGVIGDGLKSTAKAIMGPKASDLAKDAAKSAKPKLFEGVGGTVAVSNATTVKDLAGPGTYQSASAGAEVGGTVEHFSGQDSATGHYDGVGVTVGEGAGYDVDAGVSKTYVSPSVNIPDVALKPVVNEANKQRDQAVENIRKRNGG